MPKPPRRLTRLKLNEVSGVDNPANQHARTLLWKRHAEPVSKGPGADAFASALGVDEAMEQVGAFREAVYDVLDALGSAVCRIYDDDTIIDKAAAIKEAIDAALAALPGQVAEETAEGDTGDAGSGDGGGMAKAAGDAMPGDGRTTMGPAKRKLGAHLTALRDKLKGAKHAGHVAAALGGFYRDTAGVLAGMPPGQPASDPPADGGVAKGAASRAAPSISGAPREGSGKGDDMTTEKVDHAARVAELEAALEKANREKTEAEEKVAKADPDRIAKAEAEVAEVRKTLAAEVERREFVELTKRAADEFPFAGKAEDVAKRLRRIAKLDDEAEREAEMQALKAHNAACKALTSEVGKAGRAATGDGSAQSEIAAEAEKLAKAENIGVGDATRKLAKTRPDLWDRYYAERVEQGRA